MYLNIRGAIHIPVMMFFAAVTDSSDMHDDSGELIVNDAETVDSHCVD